MNADTWMLLGLCGCTLITLASTLLSSAIVVGSPDNKTRNEETSIWCSLLIQDNLQIHSVKWYHFANEVSFNCSNETIAESLVNSTCELGTVDWDEIGEYTCSFNVSETNTTTNTTDDWELRNSTINVISTPGAFHWSDGETDKTIDNTNGKSYEEESVIKLTGNEVEIHCKFRGYPVPTVGWFTMKEGAAGNETLENNRSTSSISKSSDCPTEIWISLKITDLEFSDRKIYICAAENSYGTASIRTLLRVKWTHAWLYPGIGILLETIIFGALMIFVHYKEKRNQESDQ